MNKFDEKLMEGNTEYQEFKPAQVNKHVIQSYIFSASRSRFNIVQMRIIYRLVEFAQSEMEGLLIKNNMCRIEHALRHVDITLPITSVLPEGSKHYEHARDAIKRMMKEDCEFYNSETHTWHASPIIYNVSMADRKGVIEFSVADFVWDSLLDFTYGYRQYELGTVLSLKTANSMKMYTLISGQKNPIYYSFESLRSMFGLDGKYSQSSDIIKRLIKPCKEELDKSCPWSYDYRARKVGRANVGVLIMPYEIEGNKDKNLQRRQLLAQVPSSLLYSHIYEFMRYQLGFAPKEINANKPLLDDCSKHLPNVLDILQSLKGRRRNADGTIKGKGWIISALKSELENATSRQKSQ